MGTSRKMIANLPHISEGKGIPSPCFHPDYTAENEMYEQFGGLNEIQIAQEKAQYKDIIGVRLGVQNPPQSLFVGLEDDVIMDNVLPKHISDSDIQASAMYYQEELKKEQKEQNGTRNS